VATSDTREVLRATARLIHRTRDVTEGYAAGLCGVGTWEISRLLAHTNTSLRERRFTSSAKGMAFPFGGGHVIAIDTACKKSDAMFTIRHELAHILAEEVEEALYLTAEDTMSFSERRADLFALADLTPTRWMQWIGAGKRPWRLLTLDVTQAYRELTEGWSEARLWDRARLRVRMYREHQI
jgi:Zn-dependent peptidase ImmA (M78 family)